MSSNKEKDSLSPLFYLGLILISFCLLSSQILLSRILSVVLGYHLVFMIISVVMFGLTASTLIIYLCTKKFTSAVPQRYIAFFAYLSSWFVFISFLSLFCLPLILDQWGLKDFILLISYLLLACAYICLGISLSLCLTRFPKSINKIYSINLFGSALGCLGSYFILNQFNAASSAMLLASFCALAALFFFMSYESSFGARIICLLTFFLLLTLGQQNQITNSVKILWAKGGTFTQFRTLAEKWNFFSYVSLDSPSQKPFGWGFSPKVAQQTIRTQERMILIDRGAGTVLTKFKTLSDLEYLKLDISALAYYLRNPQDVFIIGSGGGRDVLTATLFGANKITGVELNHDIIDLTYQVLGTSLANFNLFPNVKIHNDEARAFLSRNDNQYNLIQASLIDTWAASVSGAFALSENSLYTTEAWNIFLKHLKDSGILTFSRYYHEPPLQIYRMLTLAKGALKTIGVTDPKQHIILVKISSKSTSPVGTILVSKSPFTNEELDQLQKICDNLEFEIVLSPRISKDQNFNLIFNHPLNNNYKLSNLHANIDPPTDNKPFYFYTSFPKDFLIDQNLNQGLSVFRQSVKFILAFGVIFILLPLLFSPQTKGFSHFSPSLMIYFVSIGLGFMLIEMALVQRLNLFLGHPVYGLTVVLFSLLLSCGIGSFLSKHINTKAKITLTFSLLLIIGLLIQYTLPFITHFATSHSLMIKIIISVGILSIIGLLMGIPFPLGVSTAGKDNDAPLILYWGINGFCSMCATPLATFLLINFGFYTTMLAGIICYLIALFSISTYLRTRLA